MVARSYVCGAYTINFAYMMMARNHSTHYIEARFGWSKKLDDSIVTKLIFLKTKTQITCNSQNCSSYMFQTKCRKYCSC